MHPVRRPLFFLILIVSLILAGCGLPELAASPTPDNVLPSPVAATQAPTAAMAAVVTQAPRPTTSSAPQPTTAAGGPTATPVVSSKGTITFAFDAFAPYYPAILIEAKGLLKKRGYNLKLIPFELSDEFSYSPDEQWEKLKNGDFDIMAVTLNSFASRTDPAFGAITTVIDESAGADKIVARPEIVTINDLKGKRIAYNEGSVSEYFLYYALSLAGMTPKDVTFVPKGSTDEAVQAYLTGQADALSAWEPNVLDAEQKGARVLIASDELRAILDVLVTSRKALDEKSEGVLAFHQAWYEALKFMVDSPEAAEQTIIEWGHADWTYVEKAGDLKPALEKVAQATLGANQITFQQPQLLVSRLNEARDVWIRAGKSTPPQADLSLLVDGRFALAAARASQLYSTKPPTNSSFLLTAQVELPQLSEQERQSALEIVKLPLEKIDFEPDSSRMTARATQDLNEQVIPVLRSSRLYLRIEGSSAWPGPEGRFTLEQVREFGLSRATSVATYLAQQGIDPNRFIIGAVDPRFPNSADENELSQDRIVRFTLVTVGGR